jgi:hypothetical protein
MSGTRLGQSRDTASANTENLTHQVGTLKSLAQKVLKQSVPLSHTLGAGRAGQCTNEPTESGTSAGQGRDTNDEFQASARRLEAAGICIAVWEDGSMRVLITEAETVQAIDDGGTVYSPRDMRMYVTLTKRDRRMLHEFKKRFGGYTEWQREEA